MIEFKLFKTLKFFLHPSSRLNKVLYFFLFMLFFYFAYYSFTYYNQLENLSSKYKSDAYFNISNSFLVLFSFFMSMYPMIYFAIISNEKKAIEKLMKIFSCNQLKNNFIMLSLAATLLTLLPMAIVIISYAHLYDGFCTTHDYYNNIINILTISPLWFLYNIILILFFMVLFRSDIMIIIVISYTLFISLSGMFIDEYLSGKYGYKFIFFRHSSPSIYDSINNSNSFNFKYSCDWSMAYFLASLILYFLLSKNQFMKSKLFKFTINK